jgi:hypothetical protein
MQLWHYINGDGIARTNNTWTSNKNLSDILRAAGAVGGDWATQLAIDPTTPTIIVAAYQDVFRSTNRGDSWTKISTNLTGGKNLQHISVAPTDGKVIYTSFDNKLYRTYDTGANWTTINSPAGSISNIAISPTNSKTIYVTVNGGNGKRIYKSTNGGDAWTNMTLNFPNDVSSLCIAYEKGTDEGLYVGTPIGVFYKNATLTQWTYFGTGLPNTEVRDISIAYGAKKIRVGTWGRGLWETDLYSATVTALNSNLEAKEAGFRLYPNPFVESVTVEVSKGISSISLFDVAGHELEKPVFDVNGNVKLGYLPKGVYTLEISDLVGTKWKKKVVKE